MDGSDNREVFPCRPLQGQRHTTSIEFSADIISDLQIVAKNKNLPIASVIEQIMYQGITRHFLNTRE